MLIIKKVMFRNGDNKKVMFRNGDNKKVIRSRIAMTTQFKQTVEI